MSVHVTSYKLTNVHIYLDVGSFGLEFIIKILSYIFFSLLSFLNFIFNIFIFDVIKYDCSIIKLLSFNYWTCSLMQLRGCHGDEMTSSPGHLVLRVQTEPWDSTYKRQTSDWCFYFVSKVWRFVQVHLVENRSCTHVFWVNIFFSLFIDVSWC